MFPNVFHRWFPPGREQIWSIPVYPGTPLATLEDMAHALAHITGFSMLDVVGYFLAGIKPFLNPVDIHVKQKKPQTPLDNMECSCMRAVVEVRNPASLTPDLWWATYRTLRDRLHVKGLRRLTEDDQRLFDLVQELGGIPSHGEKGNFWKQVRQRWNAQAVVEKYKTERGLTVRYQRLIQKIGRASTQPPEAWIDERLES